MVPSFKNRSNPVIDCHYSCTQIFPEWRVLDTFGYATLQNIMVSDSLNTTRPMSRYVETPADISGNFDGIGYRKCESH